MVPGARLAAFLLAVLVAFSLSSFGTAHAHAGSVSEPHAARGHTDFSSSAPQGHQGQAHAVSCDDSNPEQADKDDCCMSSASCGVCVPVPSAAFDLGSSGDPVVPVPPSASLPRDPPTVSRPPKLSVTA
jgi:hypothetical protein